MAHAPKGGAIFQPTGDWYEGGQFMPTTDQPLPKGFRGKVRKLAATRSSKTGNIAELVVKTDETGRACVYYRMAGEHRPTLSNFFGTQAECLQFAHEVVAEKTKAAQADGVCPHPTTIRVA